MTAEIQKLMSDAKALHDGIEAARLETEQAGGNSSWLFVARGALAKAIEQIGLHSQLGAAARKSSAEANQGNKALPTPSQPAQVIPSSSPPALAPATVNVDAETAALRAASRPTVKK